jgi:hypothetical protein
LARRVNDRVEPVCIELGKLVLQRSVESECDVFEIHPVIERDVAADVHIEDRRVELLFEVSGQIAKDLRDSGLFFAVAFGAIAVYKENRFHDASPKKSSIVPTLGSAVGKREDRPDWLGLV